MSDFKQLLNKLAEVRAELQAHKDITTNALLEMDKARNKMFHYKSALERIANDGCDTAMWVTDTFAGCMTKHPDDQSEWCWPCIARKALEGKP